ncbi:MAG: hypothetical protein N3B18_04185 [Desulfobacterota bacterium]|nr:hypothetical protein [Thermodesulfobacteriota bacterium]
MGAGAVPLAVKKTVKTQKRTKKKLKVFFAGPLYKGAEAVDVSFQSGVFFLTPPRELLLDYRLGRCPADVFEKRYHAFLQQSYEEHRHSWDTILEQDHLVLVCSCDPKDTTCHRYIILKFLKRFGAVFKGMLQPT